MSITADNIGPPSPLCSSGAEAGGAFLRLVNVLNLTVLVAKSTDLSILTMKTCTRKGENRSSIDFLQRIHSVQHPKDGTSFRRGLRWKTVN
uniref:Uncharacterized protein n=1 Tax=Glossina austeni TaxID=7395 RepID=A0A1A9V3W7_GLOAU